VEANTNENVIETGIVSRGIYFIFKGHVSIFYKDSSELAKLGSGSYFGDISYIFNLKN
jgi:signal-transduction protein with cAMP-binding, CBS, and nucleotidyltransferase domain